MKDWLNNCVQISNEIAIILLLQLMFLLTDFTADPVDRHKLGYYFLYYVAVIILLNLLVLVYSIAMAVRHACRKCYYQKRNKRIIQERRKAALLNKLLESAKQPSKIDTIREVDESEENDDGDDDDEDDDEKLSFVQKSGSSLKGAGDQNVGDCIVSDPDDCFLKLPQISSGLTRSQGHAGSDVPKRTISPDYIG